MHFVSLLARAGPASTDPINKSFFAAFFTKKADSSFLNSTYHQFGGIALHALPVAARVEAALD
jgi:hypothetical protein